MNNMIDTAGLTKAFGEFLAVDNVGLKIKPGTIHGFIGPNGAGKTTTMKMIIGALKPTSGSGTIKDFPLGSLEARKLLGYSPEHPKFYENMKAGSYLRYMGMVCGMSRSAATERSGELLKWLDLKAFSDKKIRGFSAGMRQKLSLAQSLIHSPEVLVLDEPTANLDPAGRLSIIQNLKELCRDSKVTVFISSHILAELEKLVSEVTLLNHGRIVVESDVRSLEKKVSGNRYVLNTSDNRKMLSLMKSRKYISHGSMDENGVIHLTAKGSEDEFKRNMTKLILHSNVWLERFTMEASDLESVFMKLVGKGDDKKKEDEPKKPFWRFWE